MNGRVNLLGLLLAGQLVLLAALLFADSGLRHDDQSTFLDVDAASVDGFEILDGDGGAVRLTRTAEGWTVGTPADGDAAASSGSFPAENAKVSEVLDKLLNIRAQWPVGTTAETRERFEVTDDHFQRKLTFLSGGEVVAELYLGTSPGYRRVHARQANSDDVFSIDFANYQVPTGINDWLDKTLLAARGKISSLSREGVYSLVRNDEGWLVDGVAADQQAVEGLVERFDDLRVTGIAEADGADDSAAEDPTVAATFTVTDDDGTYQLRLSGSGGGSEYRVSSDRLQGRFAVAAYIAEQLLVDAADLAGKAGDQEDGASEVEDAAGAGP